MGSIELYLVNERDRCSVCALRTAHSFAYLKWLSEISFWISETLEPTYSRAPIPNSYPFYIFRGTEVLKTFFIASLWFKMMLHETICKKKHEESKQRKKRDSFSRCHTKKKTRQQTTGAWIWMCVCARNRIVASYASIREFL